MDQRQAAIANDLEEATGKRLADLYRNCIDAIECYGPDSPRAELDLILLAHLAREFMNSFPFLMSDRNSDWKSHAGEENAAICNLKDLLTREPYAFSIEASTGSAFTQIPTSIATIISQLSSAIEKGGATASEKEAHAVLGRNDPTDPALIPWKKALKFFVGYAHFRRGSNLELPPKRQVENQFELINNALELRLGRFFDAKWAIAQILASANAKDINGNFIKPNDEIVLDAISHLGDINLRVAFYSRLENPHWLDSLEGLGVFCRTPEVDENKTHFTQWPESFYLKIMAPIQPEKVCHILEKASLNENPYVRIAVIVVACELPDGQLDRIARIIQGWAKDAYFIGSYFWHAEEIDVLLKRLISSGNGGLRQIGDRIAQDIFQPRINNLDNFTINALIGSFDYKERLTHLLALYEQPRRLTFCRRQLRLLTDVREEQPSRKNTSHYWLPSVQRACSNADKSVENALVTQTVDLMRESIEQQATLQNQLGNNKVSLVVRCAMYALTASHAKGVSIGIYREDVTQVLLSDIIVDGEYDAEYYPLLNVALSEGLISIAQFIAFLQEKTVIKEHRSLELANRRNIGQTEDEKKEYASNRTKRWQHRALSLVDKQYLDKESRRILDDLDARYGKAPYSAEHIGESITTTGPNSPLTKDEMLDMGPHKLLQWLKFWQPTKDDNFELISHEGQGRVLARIFTSDPYFFAELEGEIIQLRPTYQRSIIGGWTEAIKNERDMPVDAFVQLAMHIAQQGNEPVFHKEGLDPFDDDVDFYPAKRAVAEGINELLSSSLNEITAEKYASLLDCILQLLDSDNPKDSEEKTFEEDPITASLNLLSSIALSALVKWTCQYPGTPDRGFLALEGHLPDADKSHANIAALAMAFGRLCDKAPDWIEANYHRLFGDSATANECQKLLLTVTLHWHLVNSTMLNMLERAMKNALGNGAISYTLPTTLDRSGDCGVLIGQWLYMGYVRGFFDPDNHLLSAWREAATGKQLGQALDYICKALANHSTNNRDILNRIQELWDYQGKILVPNKGPESLCGIASLIRSECFEPAWWGPRAIQQLTDGAVDGRFLIPEESIIELSEYDSALAVELLLRMVEREDAIRFFFYGEVALPVLENAKRANGGTLSDMAYRCMNALGKYGLVNLDVSLGLTEGNSLG